jgi:hypothetical protein
VLVFVLPNNPPLAAGAGAAGAEPNEKGVAEGVVAGVGPVNETCGTCPCPCG